MGTATVTGSLQSASGSVDVTIIDSTVQPTIILTAGNPLLDGVLGGTSAIRAFVFDENNLPVAGIVVLFTSTGGMIDPITATTNAAGEALVVLTVPPGTPDGTITIVGSALGVSGSVDVTLLAGAGGGGGGGGGGLTPGSIACISASPTTIGVRGSGLPEQSAIIFLVTTAAGVVVPSTDVNFFVTSLGGEAISPAIGITDINGQVIANLTSGIRANNVSVTAAVDVNADGIFDVTSQCTLVTIVGAPPVQGRFNLVRQFANIAGQSFSGIENPLTAFLNDRFGNPVPPNTAVSFTTNAGLVTGQGLTTDQGEAAAILQSQDPRTPEGLVIVMAHTLGQEPFIDNNGNGIFDPGTDKIANDNIPEPFIDRDGDCEFDKDDPFEIFIDVNGDGDWNDSQGTLGAWDDQIFVWDTTPVMFSGETILTVSCITNCTGGEFDVPNGSFSTLEILARDANGNPLTGAATIAISLTGAGEVTPTSFSVPDTVNCTPLSVACSTDIVPDPVSFPKANCGGTVTGTNRFLVTIQDTDNTDTDPAERATVEVALTAAPGLAAPGGNGSDIVTISGDVE